MVELAGGSSRLKEVEWRSGATLLLLLIFLGDEEKTCCSEYGEGERTLPCSLLLLTSLARFSYSCAARSSSPKSSSAVHEVDETTSAGLSARSIACPAAFIVVKGVEVPFSASHLGHQLSNPFSMRGPSPFQRAWTSLVEHFLKCLGGRSCSTSLCPSSPHSASR